MLANGCALALAIAVGVSGCGKGGSWECISKGHGGAYDECASSGGTSKPDPYEEEAKKRDAEAAARHAQEQKAAKRREFEATRPKCTGGDAKACWLVATYAIANNLDNAILFPALEGACDGKIADACFELGRLHDDVPRLVTACELGHLRACQVGTAKDPSRALTFDTRACELHDGEACERVARAHAERGDRAETEKYLRLGCREERKDACRRLGEMAAGGAIIEGKP
jgi:TPR repeat protein